MKRVSFILLCLLLSCFANAQLTGDGYYRIRNAHTGRYLSVVNSKVDSQNKSLWQVTNGGAHIYALKTLSPFSKIVSDPGSIIYIAKDADGYTLRSQGLDTKNLTGGRNLKIYNSRTLTGAYWLYATDSGTAAYLKDKDDILDRTKNTGYALANTSRSEAEVDWELLPIDNAGQYFGITPDICIGNKYYTTIYTGFPFVLSDKMKAYYVKNINKTKAQIVEVPGTTIPAGVPVIIECSSAEPADNRITLLTNSNIKIQDNLLKGIYFSYVMQSINGGEATTDLAKELRNVVPYDPQTMRVLGQIDGELCFVTAKDLTYLPANRAYLIVNADAAETLKIVDEEAFTDDEPKITPTRYDKNGVGYMPLAGGIGQDDTEWANILDNDVRTHFGGSPNDVWAVIVANQAVAVKQYSIVTSGDTYHYSGNSPRSWKLEGSNDCENWELIDERVDDHSIAMVSREEFVFTVDDDKEYSYFKFTTTNGFEKTQLAEVWINEQEHTWCETPYQTAEVTLATCQQGGDLIYECTDCHVLKRVIDAVEPLGHNYVASKCSRCGMTENDSTLLPDGQQHFYVAKYRHYTGVGDNVHLEKGWADIEFDDSDWDEIIMPIGSNGYDNGAHAGARYNTIWYDTQNTYCFRRTFTLDSLFYGTFIVKVLHDDKYKLFVNGVKVDEATDKTKGTEWRSVEINPLLLRRGKNVVAVYIEQNDGEAYHDLSFTSTKSLITFSEDTDNTALIAFARNNCIKNFKLSRTLIADTWNTIVLPFNLQQSQLSEYFGEGTRIAAINTAETNDEAVAFTTTKEGIVAGRPYLLWPTRTVEADENLSFTNSEIIADEPIPYTVGNNTSYIFTGVFDRVAPTTRDYFVADNDVLMEYTDEAENIKSFSAYFKQVNIEGANNTLAKCFTVDAEPVGIISTNGETQQINSIFSIDGRKVEKLSKGIYIINGKKIVVK